MSTPHPSSTPGAWVDPTIDRSLLRSRTFPPLLAVPGQQAPGGLNRQPTSMSNVTLFTTTMPTELYNRERPPGTYESGWWRFPSLNSLSFELDAGIRGRAWSFFDLSLSIAQCLLFICSTAYVDAAERPIPLPAYLSGLEILVALTILLESGLRNLLLSRARRTLYATMLVLVTVPPMIAGWNALQYPASAATYLSAGNWVLFYPIRFYRLYLSSEQAFAPGRVLLFNIGPFYRKFATLVSAVLSTIMGIAAFIHAVLHWYPGSHVEPEFSYFDAFFFSATCITVGPNDNIVPDVWLTRIMTLVTIFVAAVFLPTQISDLIGMIEKQTSGFQLSVPEITSSQWVIIAGNLSFEVVQPFLREFFSPDHGESIQRVSVVLLSKAHLSDDLRGFLADPIYSTRVFHYRKDPTNYEVLAKLNAQQASAVFILGDKWTKVSPHEEDAHVVRITLAFASFFKKKNYVVVPRLYCQVILPDSQFHFKGWGLYRPTVQCVDEFRMGLMAQSCTTPGFSTLMHLLSSSVTQDTANVITDALKSQLPTGELPWMPMYLEGVIQEIYQIRIPTGYHGYHFGTVARSIYFNCKAVLIGLGVRPTSRGGGAAADYAPSSAAEGNTGTHRLLMAPFNHIITSGDIGFVIAKDANIREIIDRIQVAVNRPPPKSGAGSQPAGTMQLSANITRIPSQTSLYDSAMLLPQTRIGTAETTPLLSLESPADDSPTYDGSPGNSASGQLHWAPPNRQNPNNHSDHDDGSSIHADPVFDSPLPRPVNLAARTGNGSAHHSSDDGGTAPGSVEPTEQLHQRVRRTFDRVFESTPGVVNYVKDRYANVVREQRLVPEDIDNHIIITDCSPEFPRNIEYLVESIQLAYSQENYDTPPPIVILSPAEPSFLLKRWLESIEDVHVVPGTPLNYIDLKMIKINRAQTAIVLCHLSPSGDGDLSARSIDATSLMAEMNLRRFGNRNLKTIVEVAYSGNAQLIPQEFFPDIDDQDVQDLTRQSFMSGSAILPAMLDNLICTSYFNPFHLDIFKHLIFPYDPQASRRSPPSSRRRQHLQNGGDLAPASPVLVGANHLFRANNGESAAQGPGLLSPTDMPDAIAIRITGDSDESSASNSPTSEMIERFSPALGPAAVTTRPADPIAQNHHHQPLPNGGTPPVAGSGPASLNTEPAAAGHGSDREDHNSAKSIRHSQSLPALDQLYSAQSTPLNASSAILTSGRIFLIPVTRAGEKYGKLVNRLAKYDQAIALGLYRLVESRGFSYRCVMVNPRADHLTLETDQVYVLAPRRPDQLVAMNNMHPSDPSLEPDFNHQPQSDHSSTGGSARPTRPYRRPIFNNLLKISTHNQDRLNVVPQDGMISPVDI
ncbi:hypothetical protein H4R33_002082 [Dimargaris cristalligena]|nr:hypothetical protein H4R33_002082 [Dimargaris cristalligena]